MARLTSTYFAPGEDGACARDFIDVGAALQAASTGRIVQSIDGTRRKLSASFHWSSYADVRFYVARVDGQAVARCAAFRNTRLEPGDSHDKPSGYIGMFECDSAHPEAAHQLLDDACEWLRDLGCQQVIGPMDCSTWYSYRFSTGPWNDEHIWMEPDTPSSYVGMWLSAGFAEDEQYFTSKGTDLSILGAYLGDRRTAIRDAGYVARPINTRDFEGELRLLYDMSIASFAGNTYYSPIDWTEFRELYNGMTKVVDQRLIQIVEGPDGDPAGFSLSLPNYHRSMASMHGSSGLMAGVRFMANKRHARDAIVKTLAVMPEHRSAGLGSEIIAGACDAVMDAGYDTAYFALMHDTNHSRAISDHAGGETVREYALYRREL